jgi:predicted choloylglycine hydrolase
MHSDTAAQAEARLMSEHEKSTERPAFTQRDLPEWVKSLGLPPAANEAIDLYWKPAWDAIKDRLPLLPIHTGRGALGTGPGDGVSADRLRFEAYEERTPGERWQANFEEMWPAYRAWYLRDGGDARPDLATCRKRLHQHMPELVETYERLVDLVGGDEIAARCLSLYRPPAFIVGCSQGVWTRGEPMLARNYDYPAERLEGIIIKTGWAGQQVIGMSDCLWGLLDGMNDAGLVVSLTFGGRRAVGDGFAIPLVVRYLLETCQTVQQARERLQRLPIHAAQNLSILDSSGEHLTAYLAPDRAARFTSTPATTNHQGTIDWPEYAQAVRTVEREQHLLGLLGNDRVTRTRFADAFLEPPLYNTGHAAGMGTLYTAAYFPTEGRVEYRWPGHTMPQSFHRFSQVQHVQAFFDQARAA